jgi:hypothetical protein
MNELMKKLMEFREVILWQQLNKQMIELKEQGTSISDKDQKVLQSFCFDNRLFETVTKDPLLDDVPMSLITDFSSINFLTLNATSWNECLKKLIPTAIILNIEEALADAFDVITDYDRKHGLFKREADEDDEELYDFISRYDSLLPEEQKDWNALLQELYDYKAGALSQVLGGVKISGVLKREKNGILLDLRSWSNATEIFATYRNLFVKKATSRIEGIVIATRAFDDMKPLAFLTQKAREPNLKVSIKEFIDHARDLYLRKKELVGHFSRSLAVADQRAFPYIRICDSSPFAFLKSPFPLV